MALNSSKADIPREEWDTWDPMLISEGLFSAANIFRLVVFLIKILFRINFNIKM